MEERAIDLIMNSSPGIPPMSVEAWVVLGLIVVLFAIGLGVRG